MPIAFVMIVMVTILGTWYQVEAHQSQQVMKEQSEAESVAANLLLYRKYINEVAGHTAPDHTGASNYQVFQSFNGDAATYLNNMRNQGRLPPTMAWFKGAMPGVVGRIQSGQVLLYYNPTNSASVPQRGVMLAIRKATTGTSRQGITMGPPPT